ncbi:MAG: hypothetical protein IPF47_08225 [Gemmatimonadetes bacterium]|nr:hypothetical protein [Gemmatimonadota bacterium]
MKRRLFARLLPLMTALACVDGDRRIAGDGSVPEFVGSVRCGECHSQQYVAWRGSQHAAAMQHATDSTVLGDFNDATFTEEGTTSRFFRRDGRFFVNTLGEMASRTTTKCASPSGWRRSSSTSCRFQVDGCNRLPWLGIRAPVHLEDNGGSRSTPSRRSAPLTMGTGAVGG